MKDYTIINTLKVYAIANLFIISIAVIAGVLGNFSKESETHYCPTISEQTKAQKAEEKPSSVLSIMTLPFTLSFSVLKWADEEINNFCSTAYDAIKGKSSSHEELSKVEPKITKGKNYTSYQYELFQKKCELKFKKMPEHTICQIEDSYILKTKKANALVNIFMGKSKKDVKVQIKDIIKKSLPEEVVSELTQAEIRDMGKVFMYSNEFGVSKGYRILHFFSTDSADDIVEVRVGFEVPEKDDVDVNAYKDTIDIVEQIMRSLCGRNFNTGSSNSSAITSSQTGGMGTVEIGPAI